MPFDSQARYVTVTYTGPVVNRAPTISGTPAATGQVGVVYRFRIDAFSTPLSFTKPMIRCVAAGRIA
ncbi:hypothetical protein [Steroidobacter agaridevorans]|uniref:hypothetical protein n=1 Tax=Steroidobacter agaridevorans TaxID=2695856 RepID=UPI001328F496|nr:hypothetical protein [Steroidobacter agaridevorans]GFE91890.1 hypothetical protein GCM10011488_68440 [Steroidobacter agaridevorans]